MSKAKRITVLLVCITATSVVAVLKYMKPGQLYFNSGLLLVILLTIFLESDRYTYVFGAIATALILTSVFWPGIQVPQSVLLQQSLAALIALIITFITLFVKKWYRSIEGERKQMNALFEFAHEGIILTNNTGKIILANPVAQQLFAFEAGEMLGKKIETLIPQLYPAAQPDHNGEYNEENTAELNTGHGKECYAIKKDGQEFPAEVSISYYQQHKEYFTLSFIVDVTQRKEAEKKALLQKEQLEKITSDIRKMNVELENKVAERTLILQEALLELERSQTELSEALSKEKELNEIKSRFVSMASHEFRTPLSTVLSSASLLSKYQLTEEQDKREKHIARIKSSVQHLNDLLEDFLSLGKLEEEKVFINTALFDVKDFLQQVFDEMKTALKQGQQLKLSFSGEGTFTTDKRLLKNVMINLLTNAIKFSDENKPIEITVINSGTRLSLQIKDQGIGISKEDMPHLFSTFFRGKNATNIQGTGLGLHIVKRYVNILQGQITLSSQLNEGTIFHIGLPVLNHA